MKTKTIIPYVVVLIMGVLLLNIIATSQLNGYEFAKQFDIKGAVLWHILGGVFAFLFGVLLEWRTVVKLLRREIRPSISWLHICAVLIFIISLIPPVIIVMHIGIKFPFTTGTGSFSLIGGALSHSSIVQGILSVTAGSATIKACIKNK